MRLILTQYIDADPSEVNDRLDRAVIVALDAAAARLSTSRDDVVTESVEQGLRLSHGLEILDGSELRVSGGERFTTLEIVVPWAGSDNAARLLAANTFANTIAGTLAHEVRPAA